MNWVRRKFWAWVPHRCHFEPGELYGLAGLRCRRCDGAVWDMRRSRSTKP